MSLNNCQQCENCKRSTKNHLFCMHPIMVEYSKVNEIDSINGQAVEYPIWCPLDNKIETPRLNNKLPEIEPFIDEVRVKIQKCMRLLTDGDPGYLLKPESNFELILTEEQPSEIIQFTEDLISGNITDHFKFILMYDDNKPDVVIFEIIPLNVRASTIMRICFPQNVTN